MIPTFARSKRTVGCTAPCDPWFFVNRLAGGLPDLPVSLWSAPVRQPAGERLETATPGPRYVSRTRTPHAAAKTAAAASTSSQFIVTPRSP